MKNFIATLIFAGILYSVFGGSGDSPSTTREGVPSEGKSVVTKNSNTEDISSLPEDDISPYGELAEIFNFGSDGTDLQRATTLKDLKGKIVKWSLTVYDISEISDGKYRVLTDSGVEVKFSNDKAKIYYKEVSTNVVLTVNSTAGKKKLLSLKTGNKICIKGRLTGDTTIRALDIKPAVLCEDENL